MGCVPLTKKSKQSCMIRTQCKEPRTNSVVQVYIDQTISSSVLKVNKNKKVIIQTIEEESISNSNSNNNNNSNNNRNYLKLKTIKSLMDQNISLNQLAPNINLLDDKIDKECLLTIISKGNEFTFCKKSKLSIQKTKENRSRSVIEDRNIDNLLNKRIYDFNSMKSSTKKNIDEEEMFLPFFSLKAKSALEKELNSINAYKNLQEENYTVLDVCHNTNRFINSNGNEYNQNQILLYLKNTSKDNTKNNSISFNNSITTPTNFEITPKSSVFASYMITVNKIMMTIQIKQLLLLCFKFKQIQTNYSNVNIIDINHMTYQQFKTLLAKIDYRFLIRLPKTNSSSIIVLYSKPNDNDNGDDNDQLLLDSQYKIGAEICKGAYWSLCYCTNIINNREHYIQKINKGNGHYNKEEHLFNLYLLSSSSFKFILSVHKVINSENEAYIIYDTHDKDSKEKQFIVSLNNYISQSIKIMSIEQIRTLIRNIIEIADYCINAIKTNEISINHSNIIISKHSIPFLFYSSYRNNGNDNDKDEPILNDLKKIIYYISTGNEYSSLYADKQEILCFDDIPNLNIKKMLSYLHKGNYSFNALKNNKFITGFGKFPIGNDSSDNDASLLTDINSQLNQIIKETKKQMVEFNLLS